MGDAFNEKLQPALRERQKEHPDRGKATPDRRDAIKARTATCTRANTTNSSPAIRSGKLINDGDWMVQSTLLGIMGRMAAYTGQEVMWEDVLNSKEELVPQKLDWKMKLPIAPMAIPGFTKMT